MTGSLYNNYCHFSCNNLYYLIPLLVLFAQDDTYFLQSYHIPFWCCRCRCVPSRTCAVIIAMRNNPSRKSAWEALWK